MKLTFIANACCIYESQGKTLLTDPWLVDGAFEGSWYHYPPLKTKPQDVASSDYLYISHLHPDHYDPETLKHFRRDIPVVYLDHGHNFLQKMLIKDGFTNLFPIKDGETRELGPFKLTMYAPFVKHVFHDSVLGNLIDSALVVDDGEHKVLNTNDNTPDVKSALRLKERHGRFDVAQLNYNAAGPYPSCFQGIDQEAEHERVLKRNLEHMVKIAKILEPRFTMPFAGAYILGGRQRHKNKTLGTTTSLEASRYLTEHNVTPLILGENDSLNVDPDGSLWWHVRKENWVDEYIETLTKPYDYELDPMPDADDLYRDMTIALNNLYAAQRRLTVWANQNIRIIPKPYLGLEFLLLGGSSENRLICELDARLLRRILDRKAHWNNAEIGCHIDFIREPNIYNPDVHTLMSFFHL